MSVTRLERLPGAEIVAAGLDDLAGGRSSVESAAVEMAATRLREAGITVPVTADGGKPAAHRLYGALVAEYGDAAYSRYNAIIRRMVSFARAAERAQGR